MIYGNRFKKNNTLFEFTNNVLDTDILFNESMVIISESIDIEEIFKTLFETIGKFAHRIANMLETIIDKVSTIIEKSLPSIANTMQKMIMGMEKIFNNSEGVEFKHFDQTYMLPSRSKLGSKIHEYVIHGHGKRCFDFKYIIEQLCSDMDNIDISGWTETYVKELIVNLKNEIRDSKNSETSEFFEKDFSPTIDDCIEIREIVCHNANENITAFKKIKADWNNDIRHIIGSSGNNIRQITELRNSVTRFTNADNLRWRYNSMIMNDDEDTVETRRKIDTILTGIKTVSSDCITIANLISMDYRVNVKIFNDYKREMFKFCSSTKAKPEIYLDDNGEVLRVDKVN